MANSSESKGVPYVIKLPVGILMMVAGFYLSITYFATENPPGWVKAIQGFGVPIDLGQTIMAIGVLLIVFPLVNTFFIMPLHEAIQNRNSELESTFAQADNLRTEMQTMRSDYEHRLQETEAQAREQIQSSIREAQQLRQTLMSEATEKADALVAEARGRIEQERDNIIRDLRLHVVDLTLAAAERVIGENMNDDVNRKLVNEFIDKVEVAR